MGCQALTAASVSLESVDIMSDPVYVNNSSDECVGSPNCTRPSNPASCWSKGRATRGGRLDGVPQPLGAPAPHAVSPLGDRNPGGACASPRRNEASVEV